MARYVLRKDKTGFVIVQVEIKRGEGDRKTVGGSNRE